MTRSHRRTKLSIPEIGYCKPRIGKNKKQTRKGHCLPAQVRSSLHSSKCDTTDEHCLLNESSMPQEKKEALRKTYLRPRYPNEWRQKEDTWLDNFQIADVMNQYQEAYPWFRFMGALPIDFSAPDPYLTDKTVQRCMNPGLCSLDLKAEYARGIRAIGCIFNLDPHFKGGSHWVGLYIDIHDINKPFVGYSDSYGYKPPALIARLMKSLKLQTPSAVLGYNARRFQNSSTECGMYSMYFIICMIAGISYKDYVKDVVSDKFMIELRKVLFA